VAVCKFVAVVRTVTKSLVAVVRTVTKSLVAVAVYKKQSADMPVLETPLGDTFAFQICVVQS
jgi:hypothetical protein